MNDLLMTQNPTTDGHEVALMATGMVFLVIIAFVFIIGIGLYILRSIAYYKLAKARSLNNAWMAWVPFVRDYQIGLISDDISAKNGVNQSRRILLLILSIATGIFVIAALILMFVFFANIILYAMSTGNYEFRIENEMAMQFITPLLISGVLFILAAAVEIWQFVLNCMCHFKIYKDYIPKYATLFTVITILAPLLFAVDFLPSIFVLTFYNKGCLSLDGQEAKG